MEVTANIEAKDFCNEVPRLLGNFNGSSVSVILKMETHDQRKVYSFWNNFPNAELKRTVYRKLDSHRADIFTNKDFYSFLSNKFEKEKCEKEVGKFLTSYGNYFEQKDLKPNVFWARSSQE